jgi:hypothetical protein
VTVATTTKNATKTVAVVQQTKRSTSDRVIPLFPMALTISYLLFARTPFRAVTKSALLPFRGIVDTGSLIFQCFPRDCPRLYVRVSPLAQSDNFNPYA